MCGFYWIIFYRIYASRKTLLEYTNLFSQNYYKKNDKKYVGILKINMAKELDREKLMKQ